MGIEASVSVLEPHPVIKLDPSLSPAFAYIIAMISKDDETSS